MARSEPKTFGSVDIGSNAVRFFIGRLSRRRVQVLLDRRAPIRLGQDAFSVGFISNRVIDRLVAALLGFRLQAAEAGVLHWRAIATSALRDAINGPAVVHEVWRRTGVRIEIINGLEEARLLHLAVSRVVEFGRRPVLMLDMGGGSLEVVISQGRKIRHANSLRLGTVRLLQRCGVDAPYHQYRPLIHRELARLADQCDLFADLIQSELLVGTGGNLRTLTRLAARLSGRANRSVMTLDECEDLAQLLFSLSFAARRRRLGLRRDRADVIRPAVAITLEIMRNFNFPYLQVPNVGVKNGVFWDLVNRVMNQSSYKNSTSRSTNLVGFSTLQEWP